MGKLSHSLEPWRHSTGVFCFQAYFARIERARALLPKSRFGLCWAAPHSGRVRDNGKQAAKDEDSIPARAQTSEMISRRCETTSSPHFCLMGVASSSPAHLRAPASCKSLARGYLTAPAKRTGRKWNLWVLIRGMLKFARPQLRGLLRRSRRSLSIAELVLRLFPPCASSCGEFAKLTYAKYAIEGTVFRGHVEKYSPIAVLKRGTGATLQPQTFSMFRTDRATSQTGLIFIS